MPKTSVKEKDRRVAELIAALLLGHAVQFERFSVDVSRRVRATLADLERDLLSAITAADINGVSILRYRKLRLAGLKEAAKRHITQAYRTIAKATAKDLHAVAALSYQGLADAISQTLDDDMPPLVGIDTDSLDAVADDAMVQGGTIAQWWARQAGDVKFRFDSVAQAALVNEDSNDDLADQVRMGDNPDHGTGIMALAVRNAAALVRTAVHAVANAARFTFSKNNETRTVQGTQQLSILDSRTTVICQAYSGKVWKLDGTPVGHSLPFNGGPPRHFRCRSTLVPVLLSVTDLGADIAPDAEDEDDTQDSETGPVPASWTYEDWLKRQSPAMQKDVLGAGRYDLWQRGRMALADMLDQSGNPLTLDELKARFGS